MSHSQNEAANATSGDDEGEPAPVRLRPVPRSEKNAFADHFQDYLHELSRWSHMRRDRQGRYPYAHFDLYWKDQRREAFFIDDAGETAGLLLLRELSSDESRFGRPALNVAEICVFPSHRRRSVARQTMRLVAEMARRRRMSVTWSAYMDNDAAAALYEAVLAEFRSLGGAWRTRRARGLDAAGLRRFFYEMIPLEAR